MVQMPFTCNVCYEQFYTRDLYEAHIDMHRMGGRSRVRSTGEYVYTCSICGAPFGNQENLNLHSVWHESSCGVKPMIIDDNEVFTRGAELADLSKLKHEVKVVADYPSNRIKVYIIAKINNNVATAKINPDGLVLYHEQKMSEQFRPTLDLYGIGENQQLLKELLKALTEYLQVDTDETKDLKAKIKELQVVIEDLQDRVADLRSALGIKEPMIRRWRFE